MTIRIAMWSGPRNISTAMMRAWSSRADTHVVDEPFYAAYLAETGLDHPMRAAILASQSQDWNTVAADCATSDAAPIVFQKHMCQHMVPAAPRGWMADVRHAFLIRPPGEVAASFKVKWDAIGAEDLGFRIQAELFDQITAMTGRVPPVLLASDVLADPKGALHALCAALGVSWDPAMLAWPRGPHPSDGVWGPHWYNAVIESTGFGAATPPAPVPDDLLEIVASCEEFFRKLYSVRLRY